MRNSSTTIGVTLLIAAVAAVAVRAPASSSLGRNARIMLGTLEGLFAAWAQWKFVNGLFGSEPARKLVPVRIQTRRAPRRLAQRSPRRA